MEERGVKIVICFFVSTIKRHSSSFDMIHEYLLKRALNISIKSDEPIKEVAPQVAFAESVSSSICNIYHKGIA